MGYDYAEAARTRARGTTARDRRRRRVLDANRGKLLVCHICGGAIDPAVKNPDPAAFVVDHVTPLARGGTDSPENWAPAHRGCNRDKSDLLPGEERVPRSVEPVDLGPVVHSGGINIPGCDCPGCEARAADLGLPFPYPDDQSALVAGPRRGASI